MQEVSLVSPLLFSIEDTGDNLVKIVADLLRSVSLKDLIDPQHLKQRKDPAAVATVTSQVKFLLRQQAGKSQTRSQMKPIKGCRHTNDTNLIFWRLRILKPVPLWSRRE